jgi:hypothetical protein
MKKVLLVALSLLMMAPAIQAKDKDKEEVKIVLVKDDNSDEYYYEGVVTVEGVTKEEMFKRAKEWVLTRLKTSDNNIQFNDKDFSIINNATIVIDSWTKGIVFYSGGYTNFKITLLFKDGKYKFRFDGLMFLLNLQGAQPKSYSADLVPGNKYNRHLIEENNKAFLNMSVELENKIKGSGSKNDW